MHLTAQSKLSPLYVHLFSISGGTLSENYANQLKKILETDLTYNGKASLYRAHERCQGQIKKEKAWKQFEKNGWAGLGIDHIIKMKIEGLNCHLAAFSVKENKIRGAEATLTGNLNKDRQKIHALADTLTENLFHCRGVAASRLLYTVKTKKAGETSDKWISEIWEADCDGCNAHQVSNEKSLALTPIYLPSPTQKKAAELLYVSYKNGQPKLYRAPLQGGNSKRVALTAGNQFTPAISPQGDLLAFICDALGNPDLFIQRFHPEKGVYGKPIRLFTSPLGAQGSPTFSADGKKIAFVSNKDGSPRIYVISCSGEKKAPLLISKQNRENTSPSWSPDGKKLAYSALTAGVRQIWVYDFETKKEEQLTEGATHKENPSWAPNSFHLAFNTATETGAELYIVNLNQKEIRKITSGAGEKRFPCWLP